MRRKAAMAVLAAAGVLGSMSAASYAGEAAVDGDGNFLIYDADLSSPIAGTKSKPQPASLTIHQMFGNYRSGKQPPATTAITVKLPRGMTMHPEFVGACPLPTSDADIKQGRCPAASKVGAGTALADARTFGIQDPVPATVTAYNGAKRGGKPTLVLQGVAKVGANTVVTEFDFETTTAAAPYGLALTTFQPAGAAPADPNSPGITLNKLDLKVGKNVTRRLSGRRVKRGYLEAPTTCTSRGWAFQEQFALTSGVTLAAPDVMACTR